MGALDRSMLTDSRASNSVYEPILVRSHSTSNRFSRTYGGFEAQKRKWATIDQRSHRLRYIAYAQILVSVVSLWNYLWWTNVFGCIVGCIGVLAFKSERLSWTLVYMLVCVIEFVRNVLLAQHLYERFLIPQYQFTNYEWVQVAALLVQEAALVPAAFCVVFAAAANMSNPI
ncbi:hypothetical protein PINS_up012237 [Pythium insidiosum]|nr:hypothetical protein PINS_up012237 [Pythium insidiosum]